MEKEHLPSRITKMVKELHRRGYTNLYLYCGMAPSGMSWRYMIGEMEDGGWPASEHLVYASTGPEGTVEWSQNMHNVNAMADDFERFYVGKISKANAPTGYSVWFDQLADTLRFNELLMFFADYESEHGHLLKDAPGYRNKRIVNDEL